MARRGVAIDPLGTFFYFVVTLVRSSGGGAGRGGRGQVLDGGGKAGGWWGIGYIINNRCEQIYIFGYISKQHMGTFKLHISCTQAMRSLQYRLHMEHFQCTQRGAACGPPLYILHMLQM